MRLLLLVSLTMLAGAPAVAATKTAPSASELATTASFAPAYRDIAQLPNWVRTAHATSTPVEKQTIDGVTYLQGFMCKPHDCHDNQLQMIFSQDGTKAWGLWSRRLHGHLYQMVLGDPPPALTGALMAAYAVSNPEEN